LALERRAVLGLDVLLFTSKNSFISEQTDLRDMFRKASKSVYTSNIVVYADSLSLTPSASSADEEGIQMEYSSDCWCSPAIGT